MCPKTILLGSRHSDLCTTTTTTTTAALLLHDNTIILTPWVEPGRYNYNGNHTTFRSENANKIVSELLLNAIVEKTTVIKLHTYIFNTYFIIN